MAKPHLPAPWLRRAALGAAALALAGCYRGPPPTGPVPSAGGVAATGTVLLPPGYDPGRAYPVVELLPPTGNTAGTMLQIYLSRVGLGRLYRDPPERQLAALLPYLVPDSAGGYPTPPPFLVILARGRGSADDYGSAAAWQATIERYEREVRADLRAVAAQRRVDASRFVVAGFSLGGDLAWALTLRNPDVLHGAIVMASRATYRLAGGEAAVAAALRRARVYLTMGTADIAARRQLALAAAAMLDRVGVAHEFRLIPGVGHEPAPLPTFAEALSFVLRPASNPD